MATIGQPADIETSLLRDLTEREAQYAQAWLDRAQRLILARIPDLTVRAQSNAEYASVVAGVEGEMVARVFRNPEGVRQEDEGNYSIRLDAAVASGILIVSPTEWEALGAANAPIKSVSGAMDEYAATRYGDARPDLRFQYGWPGGDPSF